MALVARKDAAPQEQSRVTETGLRALRQLSSRAVEPKGPDSIELRGARPAVTQDPNRELVQGNVLAGLFEDVEHKHLGRFEVRRLLGSGAMGAVFEAWDPELARSVALKVLHASADRDSRERLKREARGLARIRHRNVVAVHEVMEEGERLCLVMELMQGGTLRHWLRTRRSLNEILEVFAQACDGLAAAHGAGLVHRDFKPENVVFDEDGTAKVTDFGLVQMSDERLKTQPLKHVAASLEHSTFETYGGPGFAGTPAYAAPEQLSGRAGAPADVFALARCLFEALYGHLPDRGFVRAPRRAAPSAGQGRVPSRVRGMIEAGLADQPARRPLAGDLAVALRAQTVPRSKTWMAVVPLAGLAVYLGVTRSESPVESQFCAGSGEEFAAYWNPGRAEVVREAFQATGVKYWEAASRNVELGLAEFATAWSDERARACRATHLLGTLSEGALDRRMACLDAMAADAGQLVDALENADGSAVERATQVVSGLPDPTTCVATRPTTTLDPELAQRLRAADVAVRLGKTEEGLEKAKALLDDPGSAPVLAAAHHIAGRGSRDAGDIKAALEHQRQAWWGAMREDAALAADAALEIAKINASRVSDYDEAHEWLQNAKGVASPDDPLHATRIAIELAYLGAMQGKAKDQLESLETWVGDETLPEALRTRAQLVRGVALLYSEHREEGREALADALARTERRFGVDHPACAEPASWLYVALERVEADLETRDALLARIESLLGGAGQRDADAVRMLVSRKSNRARGNGDVAESARLLREMLTSLHPDELSYAIYAGSLLNLGDDERRLGNYDAALQALRRSIVATASQYGPEDYQVGMAHRVRGLVYADMGKWGDSLNEHRRAREIVAPTLGEENSVTIGADVGAGRALVGLGRPEEARPLLDSAVERLRGWEKVNDAYVAVTNLSRAEMEVAAGASGRAAIRLEEAKKGLGTFEDAKGESLAPWLRIARVEVALGHESAAHWHARLSERELEPGIRKQLDAWWAGVRPRRAKTPAPR